MVSVKYGTYGLATARCERPCEHVIARSTAEAVARKKDQNLPSRTRAPEEAPTAYYSRP
jgi:hypothetical protein